MTTYRISEDFDDTYTIDHRNGDKWVFTKDAMIETPNNGILEKLGTDVKITVAGMVRSTSDNRAGIFSIGANTSMTIIGTENTSLSTPNVAGATGIVSGGVGASIENHGVIIGTRGGGIFSSGDSFILHNTGTILGVVGINSSGNNALIVIENASGIGAVQYGILLAQASGETSRTVNHGAILSYPDDENAGFIAFQGADGDDTVINDGAIQGIIDLGSGDDLFDNRGGRIYHDGTELGGTIRGGIGDYVLITSDARYSLVEMDGQGEDVIKSSVTYSLDPAFFIERLQLIGSKDINGKGTDRSDQIWGNVSDNKLMGLGGNDSLDAGKGNDILSGGAGADLFGFASGYGKDKITDFDADDGFYLVHWNAVDNFRQLRSHASNHGADVWITAGHDTLVIEHMHKADLQQSDFQF